MSATEPLIRSMTTVIGLPGYVSESNYEPSKNKVITKDGKEIKMPGMSALDSIVELYKAHLTTPFKPKLALLAATGTGKSTVFIGKFLDKIDTRIYLTLPMITAVDNSTKAFKQFGIPYNQVTSVYKEINYTAGKYVQTSTTNVLTIILSGLLADFTGDKIADAQLVQEKFTNTYGVVVIDEVHVLNEPNILLLFNIKCLYDYFQPTKTYSAGHACLPTILFNSATVDIELFEKYFGLTYFFKVPKDPSVSRTEVKLQIKESMSYEERLELSIRERLLGKEVGQFKGFTFIFCPGKLEMGLACSIVENIMEENPELNNKFEIFKINSEAYKENKRIKEVLADKNSITDKIVICTEILEASVTVDFVFYVIDSCSRIIACKQLSSTILHIVRVPESRSNLMQRISRTGRINSGFYYVNLTQKEIELLSQYTMPDFVYSPSEFLIYQFVTTGIPLIIDINNTSRKCAKLNHLLNGFIQIFTQDKDHPINKLAIIDESKNLSKSEVSVNDTNKNTNKNINKDINNINTNGKFHTLTEIINTPDLDKFLLKVFSQLSSNVTRAFILCKYFEVNIMDMIFVLIFLLECKDGLPKSQHKYEQEGLDSQKEQTNGNQNKDKGQNNGNQNQKDSNFQIDTLDEFLFYLYDMNNEELTFSLIETFDSGIERYRNVAINYFSDCFQFPDYTQVKDKIAYKNKIRKILMMSFLHSIVLEGKLLKTFYTKHKGSYIGFAGGVRGGTVAHKKRININEKYIPFLNSIAPLKIEEELSVKVYSKNTYSQNKLTLKLLEAKLGLI
jgi:hypothetical protein